MNALNVVIYGQDEANMRDGLVREKLMKCRELTYGCKEEVRDGRTENVLRCSEDSE